MQRKGWAFAFLGLLVLVAGCETDAEEKAIWAKASKLRVSEEYVIGEGDRITIRVLGQEEFQISETVRPDGKVVFPRYGEIVVSGKTTPKLRDDLERAFADRLAIRNPKVYVAVNSFASKSFTVFGEVRVPGRFPYAGQMRVADAIGQTIGLLPSSAADRVLLFREVDNSTKIYHVNLEDFFCRGDFSTNFYIRPGDILYVPMNNWSKAASKISLWGSPLAALLGLVGLGTTTTSYFVPSPATLATTGG